MPVDFPSGHGPQQFIASMKKEYLDDLENKLKKPTNATYTIVVTHYTHELIYPISAKSSSGLDFENLLSKYNIFCLMNGHTHPQNIEAVHYGNFMELTAMSLKRNDTFALLSIDNDRLNYESFNLNADISDDFENYSIITSPTPQELNAYNFNDMQFPIRIVSFSSDKNKNFTVKGDFSSRLMFQEYLEENVSLYSLMATFEPGIRKIEIVGDLNKSMTFAVNCNSGPFVEKHTYLFNPKLGPISYQIFTVFFLIVVLSMKFLKSRKIEKYLCLYLISTLKWKISISSHYLWQVHLYSENV